MMGELIALLFLARDLAHRAHLKVTGPGSYAAHAALGDFYGGILGHADSIAEAYQGATETLLDIPLLDGALPDNFTSGAQFIPVLRQHLEWIKANRYSAAPREETAIQNIIDETVALYQSTIYKLRFLA